MLLTDAFYYLNNFQLVLDSITKRYLDLLNGEETGFIERFSQLPQVSQALMVRMIMRKPCLFRAESLHYPEIGPLTEAMPPLVAARWVTGDPEITVDELFSLTTKPRLVQLLNFPSGDSQLPKAALLARSRLLFPRPLKLSDLASSGSTELFRVNVAGLCERLRLLYFGNFRQSWTEFILADLGVTRFEAVDLSRARPFASRRHWDNFAQVYRCRERLRTGEDPRCVLAAVPDFIEGCDWLEARRQRLLFRVGQTLERMNEASTALAVYGGISHPGAAVRAIRIREVQEEATAALSACESAIAACRHEQDDILLRRARHRLRRRLGLPQDPTELAAKSRLPVIDMTLEKPLEPYSVELEVARLLMAADPQTQVFYVENCLIISLFGLLCWRALFAPIEGAFFHPFHREPADLADARFFERRRQEFTGCLAQLDDGTYRRTILHNFEAKYGIDNAFVVWAALEESLLQGALDCIRAHHLKAWFGLMARNFQANRCGFPDLIQLKPTEQSYRLIEVKAPGDRLQDNQRRVLALCSTFHMPVAVCRVNWKTAANTVAAVS